MRHRLVPRLNYDHDSRAKFSSLNDTVTRINDHGGRRPSESEMKGKDVRPMRRPRGERVLA